LWDEEMDLRDPGPQVCSVSSATLGGGNPHLSMLVVYYQYQKLLMSPTQELELMGTLVNTNALLVSLPADKMKHI